MADYLDLIPLYAESAATVRARMDADVNAGLSIADEDWLDTRQGSFYWDVTQPFVLEIARVWDAIGSEVIAAAMPVLAWGQYLELHAQQFGLLRKDAVAATGTVRFFGVPNTLVATGTVVSADPISVDDDDDTAVEFETTASGTIAGPQVPTPGPISATPSATGGTLLSADYSYAVAANNLVGATPAGTVDVTVLGPTGRVILDWPDAAGAVGYSIYRSSDDGASWDIIAGTSVSTYTDTGAASLANIDSLPSVNTTAMIELAVRARQAGTIGNIAGFAVTNLETPNDGVVAVYNFAAMTGGLEIESDDALRERVLARYGGQGGGNITDYETWVLDQPNVARVSVIPLVAGPGTVGVVAMNEDGSPVTTPVVAAVQAYLDPVFQQGKGRAPIGHGVTVSTSVVQAIPVSAHVVFDTGYSLDGAGGTTALRARIVQAIKDYIDALNVGDDVIYENVKSRYFRVKGITNISSVTVNAGTTDVVIAATTAARTGTVSFT